jgi:hypothetical protein
VTQPIANTIADTSRTSAGASSAARWRAIPSRAYGQLATLSSRPNRRGSA